jgi:2-keto-4-pentenoate hydratase/2-oxohepta-3-ene-1,7-dioic acid hydratase in catechol pathway
LKLATFVHGDRVSYGAVVGDGIVDLRPRLKHVSLLHLIATNWLGEAAKIAADTAPDIALKDVRLAPPVVAPEKILCIGVNYGNRHAEYKDNTEAAKYPSMFFRTPGSFVGSGEPLVKP